MLFDLFNILINFKIYQSNFSQKLNIFIIMYLNNICIYIKNQDQAYIKANLLVLDFLKKHSFFVNLEK